MELLALAGLAASREQADPPQDIDGPLAWEVGSDEHALHVVRMWQSQAHADRFAAEQPFPAFQALGMMPRVRETAEITTYEAGRVLPPLVALGRSRSHWPGRTARRATPRPDALAAGLGRATRTLAGRQAQARSAASPGA